ncbi:MAG: gliding motility-associated C-terminal domain-containing protein, partial [Verrucomicrobia bacterium]|nr:gliding motility-associated C-terminal domain-containing protein [Cytophagales bacterium]
QNVAISPATVDVTDPITAVTVVAFPNGFADASLVLYTWTLSVKPAASNPRLTPTKYANRGTLKLEDLSGTLPIGMYVLNVEVRAAGGVIATSSVDIVIRPRNNAAPSVSWNRNDPTVKVASQTRATTAYGIPYPTFKVVGFISDPLEQVHSHWRVIYTNTSNNLVYNNVIGDNIIPPGVSQTEDSLRLNNLSAGTYEIYLVAKDALGAKDSARYTLNVTDPINMPPVVTVMPNTVTRMPTTSFVLTGSATDTDGTIVSTAWSFFSGPSTVVQIQQGVLDVSDLQVGEYIFRFTATDNRGGSAFADVKVTVQPRSNRNPVIAQLNDINLTLPRDSVEIAVLATDPDNDPLDYRWSQLRGAAVDSASIIESIPKPGFAKRRLRLRRLQVGVYDFRLTVRDEYGGIATTDVTVTVSDRGNTAPVVRLPKDTVLIFPANAMTINGSATDAEGGLLVFKWEQLSGDALRWVSQNNNQSCVVTGMSIGEYVMRLTVTDDKGLSSFAEIKIAVRTGATADALITQKVLSPNGDNKNDDWKILGIEAYPELDVMVINEKGQTVFRQKSYVNGQAWDGKQNGKDLPEGAYFYLIRDNNNTVIKRGSFVLMR